ncbi:glutathione S-transferase N-terminal domain-containing protein [Gammaproteobacteria bacterium]|jgi:glutathione S-transferase|nr:glutathione S-transferase N-terminal domain-containing protein [Gammaproteobacteria bacterium]
MNLPILYSFRRCPYAMRARMALILASKQCELREILLKNKPDHMLEISPKGTVPVLQLPDKVLDESLDIISWATVSNLDNVHIFSKTEETLYMELVHLFDTKFKHHLDRYKYSSRYGADPSEHQEECKIILENLDAKINPSPWVFGPQVSLLDISILPFIRQCKIANPEWFDAQQFKKVIGLLDYFEQDNLFIQAMQKYELWDPRKQNGNIFP